MPVKRTANTPLTLCLTSGVQFNPASRLQPMERRIQGPSLDLEKVFRGPLNGLPDRVAVGGSGEKCAEDQEIERASQQLNMGRRLASHCVGILLQFV
jgi:hypothetical protein